MASFDQIECAVLTDVGLKRGYNQDSNYLALASDETQWQELGHVLLVADGMGAHAVGEKASEQAVKTIPHVFSKHVKDGAPESLRKAFYEANSTIHSCGQENSEFRGMGTTATGIVIRPEGAWIGHVGDSRAYRIRGKLVEQLTYDHSLVWEYARLKKIDPEDVKDIPSNYINRCLGPEAIVEPDIEGPHKIEPGDCFLICSDGLTGLVKDSELGAITSCLSAQEACKLLVDLANLRGGHDNITVIVAKISGTSQGLNSSNTTDQNTTLFNKALDRFKNLKPGIPWWFICLMFGLFLAICLIGIKALDQSHSDSFLTGDLVKFSVIFIALIFFIAGSIGFFIQFQNSKEEETIAFPTPSARIHRKTLIEITQASLSKMEKQIEAFQKRAEIKHWDFNSEALENHKSLAKEAVSKNDFAEAFKQYCLSMLLFSGPWIKQRKEDSPMEIFWGK
ncbi:MAG: serine/threonine-protein phosphatase [Planctomycetes bacterium]|nr:serine/threonine-protein phosphatase [Planctomycetota bacterium]